MTPPHLYRGGVTFVVEGNHYDIVMDVGFFTTIRVPTELKGLDLPPYRTKSPEERSLVRAAKDVAMDTLLNRWILVRSYKGERRPKRWPVDIFLDATCHLPEVMVEVEGRQMVDFSAYMNALRDYNFDPSGVPLKHAERSKKSRKGFQKGS